MASSSFSITACRVCAGASLEPVLDLGTQPLANSLRRDRTEVSATFPLELCRCGTCGTIQLTETVAPDIMFSHYVWVTGTSEVARHYSGEFCERLVARSGGGRLFVVEVASNDGTFLRRFVERGDRVLGVDPARNIAAQAAADGIPTRAEFFGLSVAEDIVALEGHADAVFARNVIPHVADANDVVAGMAHCLSPTGVGAIEFHRADVILEQLHYDSIYHEHVFYHSLHSLGRLLARFGLRAFDVTVSPISGGSLVVYFSKATRPAASAYSAFLERENALGISEPGPWQEFARRCQQHRRDLLAILDRMRGAGKRIIGYGASARSATMLNYCGINRRHMEVMADRAPLKHGLYTPGSDLLIVPPAEAFATRPDVVLLLAWNFQDEILAQIHAEHGWTGDVIVPLPGDPTVMTLS